MNSLLDFDEVANNKAITQLYQNSKALAGPGVSRQDTSR
jgi:hypothetical protein